MLKQGGKQMIITVTMNPAVDKTVEIEKLCPNDLNRISKAGSDAGGKGINVSKTLAAMGGESLAMGFLGGSAGKNIEQILTSLNVSHDFIWVEGETRTNTKVCATVGGVTELNEPGPYIQKEDIELLIGKILAHTDRHTLVVLAGSIPAGVDTDIYSVITKKVHEKGGTVLVDADGDLLKNALTASPDIIKPNRQELEEYIQGQGSLTEDKLRHLCSEFQRSGISTIAVSMGSEGAFFVKDNYIARSFALPVEVHSTVGAGDAMVAALAYAWEYGLNDEEMVRLAMAASAGAVMTTGTKPPSKEQIQDLLPQVMIQKL